MPKFRLLLSFEVKPPDGSPFPESFDEVQEFNDLTNAEEKLESITSVMVSGFSDQGYEWTILEKCVVLHKEQKGSEFTALML